MPDPSLRQWPVVTTAVQRRILLTLAVPALTLPIAACNRKAQWHETNISGSLPRLSFAMTDAMTDASVTAADFLGKVTLLYFGYTQCPDYCPTTLTNLAAVLHNLAKQADQVRILFVTVDPNRDSLAILKQYVSLFAPQMVGLRGTPDELASLARRYRVAYSVTPAGNGHPYEVTHSAIVFVFDQAGNARLIVSSMATQQPDISGTTADLRRLIATYRPPGLLQRIERIV